MSLTSCDPYLDDILGEWSRPTPNPVTPSGGGSEGGGSSTINATAIDLDQKMKVLVKGGAALTITATVTPSDATFTWESSDPTIATVENGVVTPVGLGITKITAKSGDLSATCEVFVGTVVDDVSTHNPIQNYDILAGTQNSASITIPDGYHVAFNGVTTTNQQIICSGDATIYLIDGKTNTVSAAANEAGIQIGSTGMLTINAETEGTGILNATGGDKAAGIGTGNSSNSNVTGGDITINGGVINATGGNNAAGIGTGNSSEGSTTASTSNQCGDITINGGVINATGDNNAAGIGTGRSQSYGYTVSQKCGDITIATGVTSVTAKRNGSGSTILIGKGYAGGGATQTCGKITFGTAVVFDGANWSPSPMAADTYGGLSLAISGNTWTLTPAE